MLKEKDWLKSRARKLLAKYRVGLWTSVGTVAELFLLADRFHLDPERLVVDVTRIAEVRGVDHRSLVQAGLFMKEEGLHAFDALHAALSLGDEILSSDKAFDRIGLKRIALEE